MPLSPSPAPAPAPQPQAKLGVSACLLGQPVRYDGGHKLDRYVADTLGARFALVPVCPECECGLGVPREPMRLVAGDDEARPRLVTVKTGRDLTVPMQDWAGRRVEELAGEDLVGFIFKSGSPSSGMERVKVYGRGDTPGPGVKNGVGLFARAFMERFPLIPVEEEGRLHDAALRENFIERLFTMRRWRACVAGMSPGSPDIGKILAFHTRHKLLLMAHSQEIYRAMGKLMARPAAFPAKELLVRVEELLMTALSRLATPRKHVNVLMHILGYFKNELTPDEKQEFLELLAALGQGLVPLMAPMVLARHYARKYQQAYLLDQYYLDPHPQELALRNHV